MRRLLLAVAVCLFASTAFAQQGWYQTFPGSNFGQGRLPTGQNFTTIRSGNMTFINVQPSYYQPYYPAYPVYQPVYRPVYQRSWWGWGW